jgi:hypothetical protein
MNGKLSLVLLVCAVSLAGCAQLAELHQFHQEQDVNYCESNGFEPGTELYLQCLNTAETQRRQSSQALTEWSLRTMSGQPAQ